MEMDMQDTPATVPEKVHAELGPSSSDIWLTCLQAPREWKRYPPRITGFAAHEGTLAHTLCEAALLARQIPWTPGQTYTVEGDLVTITQEMLDAVQLYTTTVNMISDFALWRIIEKKVSFSWPWGVDWAPDLFGTSDFAAADSDALYVVDFKYGRGKAVHVEGNTQLLCYGVGVYGMLRQERPDLADTIRHVSLTVVQPRVGGEPVRQWTIPIEELIYWTYAVLKPSVDKILSPVPLPLVPGNHCYFCAASQECPAYRTFRFRDVPPFPELSFQEHAKIDTIFLDTSPI